MIDHVKLYVSDLDAAVALYERALTPLGFTVQMRLGAHGVALGRERPELWLAERGERPATVAHVALRADDRAAVDAFHAAALAGGARDNGAPGPRPYHPSYYSAFVLDGDGTNLEAVCHAAPADG